jgi:hypothetical protein
MDPLKNISPLGQAHAGRALLDELEIMQMKRQARLEQRLQQGQAAIEIPPSNTTLTSDQSNNRHLVDWQSTLRPIGDKGVRTGLQNHNAKSALTVSSTATTRNAKLIGPKPQSDAPQAIAMSATEQTQQQQQRTAQSTNGPQSISIHQSIASKNSTTSSNHIITSTTVLFRSKCRLYQLAGQKWREIPGGEAQLQQNTFAASASSIADQTTNTTTTTTNDEQIQFYMCIVPLKSVIPTNEDDTNKNQFTTITTFKQQLDNRSKLLLNGPQANRSYTWSSLDGLDAYAIKFKTLYDASAFNQTWQRCLNAIRLFESSQHEMTIQHAAAQQERYAQLQLAAPAGLSLLVRQQQQQQLQQSKQQINKVDDANALERQFSLALKEERSSRAASRQTSKHASPQTQPMINMNMLNQKQSIINLSQPLLTASTLRRLSIKPQPLQQIQSNSQYQQSPITSTSTTDPNSPYAIAKTLLQRKSLLELTELQSETEKLQLQAFEIEIEQALSNDTINSCNDDSDDDDDDDDDDEISNQHLKQHMKQQKL